MLLVKYILLIFHSQKGLISNLNDIRLVQVIFMSSAEFVFRTHSFSFILQVSLSSHRDMCQSPTGRLILAIKSIKVHGLAILYHWPRSNYKF